MKTFFQILILLLTFSQLPALAEKKRIALVIGNSTYHNSPLTNPVNDARAMEQVLKEVGFSVTRVENANMKEMEQAVIDFGSSLNKDTIGLFYFSGHGTQHNGENFLLSTDDHRLVSESLLEYTAIRANYVLKMMQDSESDLNILILDACRNPPKFASTTKSFSREKGLANMNATKGILIAYATAPGEVAYDGKGKNSPYTASLVKRIREPLPIEQVLKNVGRDVQADTEEKQTPWVSTSFNGDFYFTLPTEIVAPPTVQQPVQQPQIMVQNPPPAQQTTAVPPVTQTTAPPPVENTAWLAGLLAWAEEFNLTPEQLPRDPKALQKLTRLNLGYEKKGQRKITHLPVEIGELRALQQIELYDNSLESIPKEIGQLQQLQKLDLSGNRLTNLPAEIGALHKLQKLNLYDNDLKKLPVEITHLDKLQEIDISINPNIEISNEQTAFFQRIKTIVKK